jgi:hypothetical protein
MLCVTHQNCPAIKLIILVRRGKAHGRDNGGRNCKYAHPFISCVQTSIGRKPSSAYSRSASLRAARTSCSASTALASYGPCWLPPVVRRTKRSLRGVFGSDSRSLTLSFVVTVLVCACVRARAHTPYAWLFIG